MRGKDLVTGKRCIGKFDGLTLKEYTEKLNLIQMKRLGFEFDSITEAKKFAAKIKRAHTRKQNATKSTKAN